MPTSQPKKNRSKSPALKAAWNRYIETLEELRTEVEESPQYRWAPDQRGMGYRQLFEVQAMGYNFCVGPRTTCPRIYRNTAWNTEFYCIGGNGPDFDYRTVFLDGAHTYRLTGQRRDSRVILVQLNSATPGSSTARLAASYDLLQDFDVKEDGSFEIILSAEEKPGNWIGLLPQEEYQWMLFRSTVETWEEIPPELQIERISELSVDHADADEYSEENVARRIDFMADFSRYVITKWSIGYAPLFLRTAGGPNIFTTLSDEAAGEERSKAAEYQQCVFEVAEDEALLIEFQEEPTGTYWSLQVYDLWQQVFFRTRQSTLNGRQIVKDPDGTIRIVLSRRDPGLTNWLDNAGYSQGQIILRNYNAIRSAKPRIYSVKFVDLERHLPPEAGRVTPQERAKELERRREAYRFRYGE